MWLNAFGWKGFNFGNAALSVGVEALTGSVSIGLGCQLDIGRRTIIFHGRAAFPNLSRIMLLAELKSNDGSGVAIYFREIAHWWNSFLPGGIAYFDPEWIPATWGLLDTKVRQVNK